MGMGLFFSELILYHKNSASPMPDVTPPPATPRIRRRRAAPASPWRDIATAALPLLACFLGGATEKWAEGIVVALLGVLLLAAPPRFSLGPAVNLIILALIGIACIAFLPAAWFSPSTWRSQLLDDFRFVLPHTVSPQPWMTAGCLASFLAGLSWFYYVSTQRLESRSVRRQLRFFAGGVVLLAALSLALSFAHTAFPFWHNERGFGPFPNRNQTANLLALAALIALACGHDDLRQGKKRWVFWLAALGILLTAIVLNFSRAGLALLLAGVVIWLSVLALRSRSAGTIAIGLSAALGLLTVILIFGGQTLERFNLRSPQGVGVSSEFRWLVFRDALEMIRASPWCGVGLGNFEALFALFRHASVAQTRSLHPESDWFWLCAEIGWPAIVLILLGLGLLARRAFPLSGGTAQRLRLAALIAALLFLLHGLIDVSGHRVGTAFAGILLFGRALRPPDEKEASVWLPPFFRLLGAALLILGATYVAAAYRGIPLPGGVGVEQERRLAKSANVDRHHRQVIEHATRGLTWAPLDWQLYFLRALAQVGEKRPPADALADFRRGRFLEPISFEVPYQEGLAWLPKEPVLAITAWREALRRAGPYREELYGRMLTRAAQFSPVVNRMLEEFGSTQPDLALAFLERAKGEPFTSALNRLLEHDSDLDTLTGEQRVTLFDLWSEQGDLAQLNAFIERQPAQLALAWPGAAKHTAARQDFRTAYELAKRFGGTPALPEKLTGSSIEKLQRAVYSSHNNYAVGFTLYDEQMRAGNVDDALTTVRHFTSAGGAPAYFHFLEAEAWAAKGSWDRAWEARQAYDRAAFDRP